MITRNYEFDIAGNWDKKKQKLQQNFLRLSDEDLHYSKGREEELIERIQHRLEISNYNARKIIYLA